MLLEGQAIARASAGSMRERRGRAAGRKPTLAETNGHKAALQLWNSSQLEAYLGHLHSHSFPGVLD